MANLKRRLAENIQGEFYVDSRCIDCDACRQIAPANFREQGGFSVVFRQPASVAETRDAARALLACPTGSIGTMGKRDIRNVADDFPLPVDENVYYCGFNSPKSFGGNSYFVRHPDGNWLIDSPRFTRHLVEQLEKAGGIRYIFLTHRDDVADAQKFAEHFSSQRIIHRQELRSQPGAEVVLDGDSAIAFSPDFLVVPTPGHTRGHCCLLYRNRYLFTGDHLDWDRTHLRLDASEEYCWYSWELQKPSLARLLDHSFEWILPGHGQRVFLPREQMRDALLRLLQRIGLETSLVEHPGARQL